MARIETEPHWRDSARNARFFVVDARAAFTLLLFLLHIRLWTFLLAVSTMIFFSVIEYYGFTPTVFGRWLRSFLAGPHKTATPWWKE